MRNTRKILIALLVVMTLLVSMAVVASAAATTVDTTIYLTPNENWKAANARFALYTWDGGDQWFDMTDTNGDGIYECTIPAGIENIIFCRMNPSTTVNGWSNKWNQTGDLKYDGTNNHYTIDEGQWDSGSNGTWSLLEIGECIHTPTDDGTVITAATCTVNGEVKHVCSKCTEEYTATILATGHSYAGAEAKCSGCDAQAMFTVAGDEAAMLGTEWDPSNTDNMLVYNAETGLWTISYTNSTDAEVWLDFKVCLDGGWNTAWGAYYAGQSDADNAYVGVPAGAVVTISFDYANQALAMTTHSHVWSDATCTEPQKCECGETQGEALGHSYVDGACSACGAEDPDYVAPHVNALVVGDTNKIVISGTTVNDYGYPIEWVAFVADEAANYSFVGEGITAFIFDSSYSLVSATGVANLEAGNYLVCLGASAAGEYNVAVTKSAWVNALVEGANKIYIDDSVNNGANYYVAVVPFEVTEAGHYAFTSTNAIAFIYDAAVNNLCNYTGAAELEAGTYYVWISAYTELTTGIFDITLTKTAIGGGDDPVEPEYSALNLGDNTVVIDGSVTNLTGQAIAWLEFVVTEDGIYTVSSEELNCYICADPTFNNNLCGWTGTAELTAGTYYVAVGNDGITGEFTVKAEKLADDVELPAINTVVVGENTYVLNQALKDKGYEWVYLTVEEDGTYVISGISPLIFFIWPDYPNQATVPETAPFVWNVDNNTGLVTDTMYVDLVAGTYLAGFRYDAIDAESNPICHVGEYTYTISLHEHEFVEGECKCGEKEPVDEPEVIPPVDETPSEEPVELNLFQKILKAITEFFAKIGDFFKNLFVKK